MSDEMASGYGFEGATCAAHQEKPATDVCHRCGDFVCASCAADTDDGEIRCVNCRDNRREEAGPLEWEIRDEIGFGKAFFETVKQSLTQPHKFFLKVDPNGGYKDPMLYIVLTMYFSVVGAVAQVSAQFLSGSMEQSFGPGQPNPFEMLSESFGVELWMLIAGYAAVALILGPLMMILSTFINAAILHLACSILDANKGGYQGTFRLISYSYGVNIISGLISLMIGLVGVWNATLFQIVSTLGGLVSMVVAFAYFALLVFGIRDVHDTTLGRAIGVVAMMFGVLFGLVCGCAALAGGLGAVAAAGL